MSGTNVEQLLAGLAELLAPHIEERIMRRLAERAAPPANQWCTVEEYAEAHSLCTATVRKAFRDGRLAGERIGKRAIRIRRDAMIALSPGGRAAAGAETPAERAARILGRRS